MRAAVAHLNCKTNVFFFAAVSIILLRSLSHPLAGTLTLPLCCSSLKINSNLLLLLRAKPINRWLLRLWPAAANDLDIEIELYYAQAVVVVVVAFAFAFAVDFARFFVAFASAFGLFIHLGN